MNPDYEQQSSAEVDRLLKELPELTAPATLAPRVMNAIHRQASPARRWSWETWPRLWQAALLVALLALFGGLCLAASKFSMHPPFWRRGTKSKPGPPTRAPRGAS